MVVGAGVLGVTTAYRLAQRGADVVLVDAGPVGAGTSGATFAHVNASYAGYWDYVELRHAGVAGYRRLRSELGAAPWLRDVGFVEVHRPGTYSSELDRHLCRLRDIGYHGWAVDGPGVASLEPGLSVDDVGGACFFADEGYVDLPAMLGDLTRRARSLGVSVRTDDPVVAVTTSGSTVTGVRLRSGADVECDHLVTCGGRWTDDLLALAGARTTLVAPPSSAELTVPGLLVVTTPTAGGVSRVVSVDDLNLRPDGGGRTMLWSGMVDARLRAAGGADAGAAVIRELAQELLRSARQVVPALGPVEVGSAVVALRAMPADGMPVVGAVEGIRGLYVLLAHAAVTLAPVLAEIAAAEIVDGRTDDRVERFRAGRLIGGVRAPRSDTETPRRRHTPGNHPGRRTSTRSQATTELVDSLLVSWRRPGEARFTGGLVHDRRIWPLAGVGGLRGDVLDACLLAHRNGGHTWLADRVLGGQASEPVDPYDVELGPPVTHPDKILCLGLNYVAHAAEAGFEAPAVPIIFSKFRNCLIGPHDPIVLPRTSSEVDFEGELAVVIGRPTKYVEPDDALAHVAGYLVFNDVTARDIQLRTSQWTSGKAMDTFAPIGPGVMPADLVPDPQALTIETRVSGEVMQRDTTAHMIFGVAETVAYLSTLMTLQPGDIIATGTPEGVGFKQHPPRFLTAGDTVEASISGLGTIRNPVITEDHADGGDGHGERGLPASAVGGTRASLRR